MTHLFVLSRMALRISDLLILLGIAILFLGVAYLIDLARKGQLNTLFKRGITTQEE